MDAGFISQYDPSVTRRLTTDANPGLPDRCLLRHDSGAVQAACATKLIRVNCIKSSDMCASIKTDLDNVGLLDGGGKMTEGGQGERGRHADVRQ